MLILLVLVQPLALVSCGDSAAARSRAQETEEQALDLLRTQQRLQEAALVIVAENNLDSLSFFHTLLSDAYWNAQTPEQNLATIRLLTYEFTDSVGPRINVLPRELRPEGFEPFRRILLRTIEKVL
jgi:hypothetical protein